MIDFEKINCTGCSACANGCPSNCIEMKESSEGFLCPEADSMQCLKCDLCDLICPVINCGKQDSNDKVTAQAFAVILKDENSIYNSTSGGAFSALAENVLIKGGIVFGASFDKNFNVKHTYVTSMIDLPKLKKSKYVQSEIGYSYRQAEHFLKEHKPVLFSGTPCQIAGLKAYLRKEYNHLLAVEIFCHAIPSPGVWKSYLREKEDEYSAKVVDIDFRYKFNKRDKVGSDYSGIAKYGWKNPVFRLEFSSGEEIFTPMESDVYLKAFSNGLITRLSCHGCKFKLFMNRSGADISIGDFWGIETVHPEVFNEAGVSAVVAHSAKGEKALTNAEDRITLIPVDACEIVPGNKEPCCSLPAHENRLKFFQEFSKKKYSVSELMGKFLGYLAGMPNMELRIGLVGSFNSRWAINTICAASKSKLQYHLCNTSLISLMSASVELPDDHQVPGNPFRYEMLKADFSKDFIISWNQKYSNVDVLCIDLLEERFDLVKYNKSYITLSDAYIDARLDIENTVDRLSVEAENLWKSSCLRFIEFLNNNFDIKKMILIRHLLSETHSALNKFVEFSNISKIKRINSMLSDYYDYFINQSKIKHVISIEGPASLFCDERHRHGCLPCHKNELYNTQLSGELFKTINLIIGDTESEKY